MTHTVISVVASLIFASSLAAQEKRIYVDVKTAATPAEQFERCELLYGEVLVEADAAKRLQKVLTVMANLDVIQRKWPNDKGAAVHAAVWQADVAMQFDLPRNAVESLRKAPRRNDDDALSVERRLGWAYDMLDDADAAERHYLAAEKLVAKRAGDRQDSDAALYDFAKFYIKRGREREGIKRLRAAADLPNQQPLRAAILSLAALKAAIGLTDDHGRAEARRLAQDADQRIRAARAARADSAQVATVERDVARLKANFGL